MFFFSLTTQENPEEYQYGVKGGQKYLQNYLQITEDQQKELQSVRKFINFSFEELSCFLLPHPGMYVIFDFALNDTVLCRFRNI